MNPLQHFQSILSEQGLQPALKFLNARTPHRYTGVFRFDPPVLRNAALADAWDQDAPLMGAAPLEETFCGFVRTTGSAFMTNNGRTDERLTEHILRTNAVESYCGAMIVTGDGQPFGTLCHFDTKPCDIAIQELEFLEGAAELLAQNSLLEALHAP